MKNMKQTDKPYPCRNCDELTTNFCEVCDKCYRDPKTNSCEECHRYSPGICYPYVCGNCIRINKHYGQEIGLKKSSE